MTIKNNKIERIEKDINVLESRIKEIESDL
jgi:hypothetical protein